MSLALICDKNVCIDICVPSYNNTPFTRNKTCLDKIVHKSICSFNKFAYYDSDDYYSLNAHNLHYSKSFILFRAFLSLMISFYDKKILILKWRVEIFDSQFLWWPVVAMPILHLVTKLCNNSSLTIIDH